MLNAIETSGDSNSAMLEGEGCNLPSTVSVEDNGCSDAAEAGIQEERERYKSKSKGERILLFPHLMRHAHCSAMMKVCKPLDWATERSTEARGSKRYQQPLLQVFLL